MVKLAPDWPVHKATPSDNTERTARSGAVVETIFCQDHGVRGVGTPMVDDFFTTELPPFNIKVLDLECTMFSQINVGFLILSYSEVYGLIKQLCAFLSPLALSFVYAQRLLEY